MTGQPSRRSLPYRRFTCEAGWRFFAYRDRQSCRPLGAGRHEHKVHVIDHQDAGFDRTANIGDDLHESIAIGPAISVIEDACLTIDAALQEMDRRDGKHETRPARYPPMLDIRRRAAKARYLLTRICVWLFNSRCLCRSTPPSVAREAGTGCGESCCGSENYAGSLSPHRRLIPRRPALDARGGRAFIFSI